MKSLLEFNQNARIIIESIKWDKIEDYLIKVTTKKGQIIILSHNYSKVWIQINQGITLFELWEKVKSDFPNEIFLIIVKNLCEIELISIITHENEFDLMFN